MTLEVLPQALSVCKLSQASEIDLSRPFCFVGITDGELSLVCETDRVPPSPLAREDGWRAFRVAGSMPFALVGVLARLTGTLAARGVAVFAVSTFDTDYVLVKADRLADALSALETDGHDIRPMP